MKKFKKIILTSALALSVVAVPLTTTQQASAEELENATFTDAELSLTTTQQVSAASPNCKLPNDGFIYTTSMSMTMSQWRTFPSTSKIEIISGADVVALTPGNSLKPLKRGKAVVHEHYTNNVYISFEVVVY